MCKIKNNGIRLKTKKGEPRKPAQPLTIYNTLSFLLCSLLVTMLDGVKNSSFLLGLLSFLILLWPYGGACIDVHMNLYDNATL